MGTGLRLGLAGLMAVMVLSGCHSADRVVRTGQPETARYRHYVAIGDSYTSGAGIPVIDTTNGCQRSSRNYPKIVARLLGIRVDDVSCGLASSEDVTRPQTSVTPTPPPMIDAVTDDTDLVTISLGLNDQFLYDVVVTCPQLAAAQPLGHPCTDYEQSLGADGLLGRVPGIGTRLVAVIRAVSARAPGARILLVGVPQLVPAHGSCSAFPIDAGDYAYFRRAFVALGEAMAAAAEAAGADYVDVLDASEGHDLCAGRAAWVNGVVPTPTAIAYHPVAAEQAATALLVVAALDQ